MANSKRELPHYIHKITHSSGYYHLAVSKDSSYNLSAFIARLKVLRNQSPATRVSNFPLKLFVHKYPDLTHSDFKVDVLNKGVPFDSYATASTNAVIILTVLGTDMLLTTGYIPPLKWPAYQKARYDYENCTELTPAKPEREHTLHEILTSWGGTDTFRVDIAMCPIADVISYQQLEMSYIDTPTVDLTLDRDQVLVDIIRARTLVVCKITAELPRRRRTSDVGEIDFIVFGSMIYETVRQMDQELRKKISEHTPTTQYKYTQ
jgi:hypothetical protein